MRYGASRSLSRHPQSVGYWSMHLFGGPVEYRNEERMASDNSGQSVHILGFRSRDIKKLTVSAVLVCMCVFTRKRM